MAEANPDQVSLHTDTINWLAVRTPYRQAYSDAIGREPPEEGEEALPEEAAPVAVEGCEVDVGGCATLNEPFENWPPPNAINIEKQSDVDGWPSAEGLYESIEEKFKEGGSEQMEEIIIQQRQANTLESYRKMLLHKKYRRCHHLAALAYCMSEPAESQSESELQRLMLNELVGRTGESENEEVT